MGCSVPMQVKAEGEEEGFEEALREATISLYSALDRYRPKLQPIPGIPEVVDDFLRNFLCRSGLIQTFRCFEMEWYGSPTRTPPTGTVFTPDALTQRQLLQSELKGLRKEVGQLQQDLMEAGQNLDKMKRETEFHRLQHQQATAHKMQLNSDLKQLREHHAAYGPVLRQVGEKYKVALRQKALLTLEMERAQKEIQNNQMHGCRKTASDACVGSDRKVPSSRPQSSSVQDQDFSILNHHPRPHVAQLSADRSPASFHLSCSFRAHQLPVSCIRLHPQKPLLASTSDDHTWKLWTLPSTGQGAQELLTAEGHSDWLTGCNFHPDGTKLATTSGDCTVRLWDISRSQCILVLPGHLGPTWSSSFHSYGHLLASSSSDRTVKLWDLSSHCCHFTLRRHAAAVRSVEFLPLSNLLLTCSADRTIALWDTRLGVCTTAFVGHQNPCNHATFHTAGEIIASCDSGGVVSLWDIRKPVSVRVTLEIGASANEVAFSPTGRTLVVAGGDGHVCLLEAESCTAHSQLGHSDSVQSVIFDLQRVTLMSAGRDGVVNVWGNERQEGMSV